MIRFFFICAFLLKSYSIFALSFNSNNFADSLLLSGKFENAALEYEREVFISPDETLKAISIIKKSCCYKLMNEYGFALETLSRIDILKNLPDSIQYDYYFQKALNYFLLSEYNSCEVSLKEMVIAISDTVITNKSRHLLIIALNQQQKWSEADSLFKIYCSEKEITISITDSLLKKPNLANIKTAKVLSSILPGLGQAYSGKIIRGFTSLVLNAGITAYIVYSIFNPWGKVFISGITTGFTILNMFYSGGIAYSEYLTLQKNAIRISHYNSRIKEFILNLERRESSDINMDF